MLWKGKARLGAEQGPHKSMAEKGLSCSVQALPIPTLPLFSAGWEAAQSGEGAQAGSRRGCSACDCHVWRWLRRPGASVATERREKGTRFLSVPIQPTTPSCVASGRLCHLCTSFIRWGQGSCSGLKETIPQTLAKRVLRGGLGAGSKQLGRHRACPHTACCVAGEK